MRNDGLLCSKNSWLFGLPYRKAERLTDIFETTVKLGASSDLCSGCFCILRFHNSTAVAFQHWSVFALTEPEPVPRSSDAVL